ARASMSNVRNRWLDAIAANFYPMGHLNPAFALTRGVVRRPANTRVLYEMDSDLQIAQRATLLPIQEITGRLGLLDDEVVPYGRYKAKVRLEAISRLGDAHLGKYIV